MMSKIETLSVFDISIFSFLNRNVLSGTLVTSKFQSFNNFGLKFYFTFSDLSWSKYARQCVRV